MNRLPTLLLAFSLATISFGSLLVTPSTGQGGPPDCRPSEVLENDDVLIWFQGLKGHLQVFNKDENGSTLAYDYQTGSVRELAEDNETLANFKLDRAFPQDSTCTIVEDENSIDIYFSIEKQVKRGTTQGQSLGLATVEINWHWNKTAEGIKFDLLVHDWPWQSDASQLAFDFGVISEYQIQPANNGLGFHDGEDDQGYIEWAPNFTAFYDSGDQEGLVERETVLGDDNTTADVTLRFADVDAGYERLKYDPWIGVGDYIIVRGHLIGLGPVRQAFPEPLRFLYDDFVSPVV